MLDPHEIHVHALVDSLGPGGAELLLAELAAVAPAAGLRLSVGYLQERGGSPGAVRLRSAGIEPSLVGIPSHLYHPGALQRVHRHLAEIRPDVLHTHLGSSDFLGGLTARTLGIPAVSTIHSIDSGTMFHEDPTEFARDRLVATVRRHCMATVIAVSEQARAAYLENGRDAPERVAVVRNGVGASALPGAGRGIREELGIDPDQPVVAMVSALRPEKAHEVAISAVAKLTTRLPALRLLIVGEGSSRASIERDAAPLGHHVRLLGHRDDVMAIMDAVDVLIHPSRQEAFPTTLLEAMAAGTPIVATCTGGIPEIVENDVSAILIPSPPRPGPLADAIAKLLGTPDLRAELAVHGRARFSQQFAAGPWARRLREAYVAAIGQRAS